MEKSRVSRNDAGESRTGDQHLSRERATPQHAFLGPQSEMPQEDDKGDENSSSPPHSSGPTTGTTTTPASSVDTGTSSPTGQQHQHHRHHGPDHRSTHSVPEFPRDGLASSDATDETVRRPASRSAEWEHPIQERLISQYASVPRDPLLAAPPPTMASPHVTFSPRVGPSRHGGAVFPAAIKFLVSNNVAGSIIGRSGQTISDLQAESSTRIKLSQSGDYYPGTQERVCLVQGPSENVKRAASLLLARFYALQQQQQQIQQFAWQRSHQEGTDAHTDPAGLMLGASSGGGGQLSSFSFVVRVLLPAPCCGMIIGKSGANIKQMVDVAGVSTVRLAPKEGTDPNHAALVIATGERAVTITGSSLNSCITCICIILDAMASHPDICRYSNMTTSYSRVLQADVYGTQVAAAAAAARAETSSATPPSRPMEPPPSNRLWDPAYAPTHQQDISQGGSFDLTSSPYPDRSSAGAASLQQQSAPYLSSPPGPSPQESIPYSPMYSGAPALPFIPTSPGLGTCPPSPARAPSVYTPFDQGPPPHAQSSMMDSSSHGAHVPNSLSAPDLFTMQFQDMRLSESPQSMPGFQPAPLSYGPPVAQNAFTAQVAIPDSLIGSILAPRIAL